MALDLRETKIREWKEVSQSIGMWYLCICITVKVVINFGKIIMHISLERSLDRYKRLIYGCLKNSKTYDVDK